MQSIKFGPAGLGGVKEAITNLEKYKSLGLEACEIAFTYGVYIKHKEDAEKIGEAAKKLGIELSIHAPYYINLNSKEREKVEKSKQRILECLRVGSYLNATRVIFHPGYYNNFTKEETYNDIKKQILELDKEIKEKGYTPKLAPETTGKTNVFGSIDEISSLVEHTGCEFCIDFAHILAREKDYKFKEIIEKFGKYKSWHCHFSGIEFGEKGERRHRLTERKEWVKLLKNLPKNTKIIIINESPAPVQDSVSGAEIYHRQIQKTQ